MVPVSKSQIVPAAWTLQHGTYSKVYILPVASHISAPILKICAAALAHPLTALFTQSFSLCQFPSAWKLANITAIHKHDAKTEPLNYRPMSLFPNISKVMEFIIAVDIKSWADRMVWRYADLPLSCLT